MAAPFYLGSIVIANLLVITFGIIDVAELTFRAGAAAVAFTLNTRDLVQRPAGLHSQAAVTADNRALISASIFCRSAS
ncbi:MAG: hypothetical protein AB1Z51_11955 [Desulfuromonadales bacterium]